MMVLLVAFKGLGCAAISGQRNVETVIVTTTVVLSVTTPSLLRRKSIREARVLETGRSRDLTISDAELVRPADTLSLKEAHLAIEPSREHIVEHEKKDVKEAKEHRLDGCHLIDDYLCSELLLVLFGQEDDACAADQDKRECCQIVAPYEPLPEEAHCKARAHHDRCS